MKRFHVHVAVDNLAASVRFYSTVFGVQPSVLKEDYAKWMLDEPRVNFAISMRGAKPGLDHLGVQVDSDAELTALRAQVRNAEIAAFDQRDAACCYAKSDKYWITDPQGIAWETFHTLSAVPVFGADTRKSAENPGCCAATEKLSATATKAAASGTCC
jgi:hypothetical protein